MRARELINQGVKESVEPTLPKVLYHGGPKPITKFNIPPYGVYFTPHLNHAQGYGDVVTAARVDAKNVYLIDYENDIDDDLMDALFAMNYDEKRGGSEKSVEEYIKLLQKQGYDAMQSISDSEMVVVFPGTPIQVLDNKQGVSEGYSNTTFNVDRRKLNEGRAEAPFTALDAVKSILGARNITTDKNNLGYNQFYIRDVTPGSSFRVTSKDKQEYPYIFRGGEVRRNVFSYFQPMNKNARNDTGGIAVLQFPFNSKDALDVGAAVHEAYHARIYKSQQQQNKKTHGNEQLVNNMAEKWLRKNLTGFALHTALEGVTSSRISYGVAEGMKQNQSNVRKTLNYWMEKDQQYRDPTQRINFQSKIWPYIENNIKTILSDKGDKGDGDYPSAAFAAWLLVQHMDAYPNNQVYFYNQLKNAIPNHPKLQFLRDRASVNLWIMKNANKPEYYVNGKALPNPTVNVRNPAIFKDAGIISNSREEALQNAKEAGNKLLVAAVQATNALTQPSFKQGVAENTIDEMTQRTGKLNNKMSQNFVDKNKELWYKSPIIGQIEEYDLRKYNEIYSLWNNSDYVASAMLKDINDSGISDTGLFHVAVEYRGQKILSKLLWNFKTRQNRSILRIDPYHSDDLYDIIYGSGLSRFKKYWMDNNGNIEPYDKSTVNKYYSYLGKTNWQLILENNYNYSDMPHFSEGKNWITEDYSWQII